MLSGRPDTYSSVLETSTVKWSCNIPIYTVYIYVDVQSDKGIQIPNMTTESTVLTTNTVDSSYLDLTYLE